MAGRVVVSTLNNDTGVLATQNGMTGIAKAWVNFNGTGTVAIRQSFNVSSITDNGTGDYTVNFTTAMPNADYVIAGWARNTGQGFYIVTSNTNTVLTTTSARIQTAFSTSTGDADFVTAAFFSS